MAVARQFHTASLLQNGQVLIAGGAPEICQNPTAKAELYLPDGSFKSTGNMIVARCQHTATVLADGRVLIFGGGAEDEPAAEIYDPGTGSFSTLNFPATMRTGHTATLLTSGKVLIAGGLADTEALLFDPSTNSLQKVGNMVQPRTGHTATLLSDGKVLIVGGATTVSSAQLGPADVPLNTAEVFDPQTGQFTAVGSLSSGRLAHTAVLLHDGTVLVSGGFVSYLTNGGYISQTTQEIFDPATSSFTPAETLRVGRFWHQATLLNDGSVLLSGGIGQDIVWATAEIRKP